MREKDEFLRILLEAIGHVQEGEEDACRAALYEFMEEECGSR